MKTRIWILLLLCNFSSLLFAQRDPVLKQIDLPHNYYFREMYLPQVTTGPSSVSWSPDSQSVVYAMAGSLWIQKIDSNTARQITAGPGYDYEPDWSPDGKQIVFSRYDKDAVDLWLMEVATGTFQQLTSGGNVNIDARWSPDGKKIAFVSTAYNKRFHIFVAQIASGASSKIQQITEERKTEAYRYYYSPFDHEISPAWSPDSSEILFVGNHDSVYGSGGFWRMKAEPGAKMRQIRYEETTWKAHPDWSPDGKRVIYSSYLGRNWNQLWIMTSEGGDPFPITYGEFDNTAPRWSPDGKSIAFISNQDGNTSLWTQEVIGGSQKKISIQERRYMKPMGKISLTVLDSKGAPTPARVSITGEDNRTYFPADAWIHADDSFVRSERPFEAHYFHTTGKSEITVPVGKISIEVLKGFEHKFEKLEVSVRDGEQKTVRVQLKMLALPPDATKWMSGDLHVHMNYGGAYRNTPRHLMIQAAAENLSVVYNLIVNKEQRIPDIAYYSPKPDPLSNSKRLLVHSQEFHTSYWGHLGLLNLTRHYLIPDYSSYSNTASASPYPTNTVVAEEAHAQGALVGYVHPFETVPDPADKKTRLVNELPVTVALGKADYIEVVGFSDHKATAEVWYRLLNSGFRLATGAGTDAMENYASLRGPLGTDRVYVKNDGPLDANHWNENLKKGHAFATNGPLVWFTIGGKGPGDELDFAKDANPKFQATLRSIVPIDHLEIVCNGKVIQQFELKGDRTAGDFSGTLPVSQSQWCVLRAWNENATYPVLDIYPYATTNPVYVIVGGKPIDSREDKNYFIAWIDRMIEATKDNNDYNTDSEKQTVLKMFEDAKKVYQK
jgi:TolB protein